ncbi:exo-beta-N-acetylmuramidase NamZ family protein [Psychroserpens sp. S379A]|uniref:exo-beta-N-acetylmuramidase NamZ family protein n=1 Tax=Psychroserpens sp. S379A TaxID=3415137 RepID=UPI003C7EDA1D
MRLSIFKNRVFPIIIALVLVLISCGNKTREDSAQNNMTPQQTQHDQQTNDAPIGIGANQMNAYLPLLQEKRVGIVANQTSVVFKSDNTFYTHIVDSLLSLKVNVKKVFAPEHGFRGKADAGELLKDGVDTKTGVPIVSIYGKNKKPSKTQLANLDIVVFDIQDVGARFYTYISSLHYVMEACAEANIPVMVLDRPNPNGHYIDGPILEMKHKGFVGMHPIPVVHGMTIGEYAQMINGEGWLENGIQCELKVIPMSNYKREYTYSLPIKPSPNLPNDVAINLYPSLCFFEGTNVSAGRGTDSQFQIYGSPFLNNTEYTFEFVPQANEGAKHPKHKGKVCYGEDLRNKNRLNRIHLDYLIKAYQNTKDKHEFFIDYFTTLAGTTKLQEQIENGVSEKDIRASWAKGLLEFKSMRAKYLIYN